MVGCRNVTLYHSRLAPECIKCSDGGVSEQLLSSLSPFIRVYQVFRWWGVGTPTVTVSLSPWSVSSVPMVGCRNQAGADVNTLGECIKCSDGGVSELWTSPVTCARGVYQVFRWWGVGTCTAVSHTQLPSVSSVPMVGCRNFLEGHDADGVECIKCSDGGVSELVRCCPGWCRGVYQVFRWWGVGTPSKLRPLMQLSVSSVPMVGCRNYARRRSSGAGECIKCSDGGVSEHGDSCSEVVEGVYQVFRWWGVGTGSGVGRAWCRSVSSVPMVGCRNQILRTD